MSTTPALRVRRSLTDLQHDYDHGVTKPLEDLMRAWKGIKELPPEDPHSFFVLGGYHGEPFRGAGWGSGAYWGGYCNHGNVLFPVWHRIYLNELEAALRSIPGCEEVTMPFWDECDLDAKKHGIPWALTNETFELDGEQIANPLRSYVFPVNVVDHLAVNDPVTDSLTIYSKPKGYETVRYPYSGLVGTPEMQEWSTAHNSAWTYPEAVKVLNQNIVAWLTQSIEIVTTTGKRTISTGVAKAFADCLHAPHYTVFSNTTSAQEWNDNAAVKVVPIESPHNKIHLAIGGYDPPGLDQTLSVIRGANGDMNENDTAGLDPIFFFHHCFIDRIFWLWQQRHGATDDLEITPGYPGTNSVDSQGPTPGVPPNTWLSMDSPLDPFTLEENGQQRPYTGRDACNIERQLGYRYGPGSLEGRADALLSSAAAPADEKHVHVIGADRGQIRGSFLVAAYATVDGEPKLLGAEAVLSRWHVEGCANCQTHLPAGAVFPLHGLDPAKLGDDAIYGELRTHDAPQDLARRAHPAALGGDAPPRLRIEIR